MPLEQLIKRKGVPDYQSRFRADEIGGEDRLLLLNYYPQRFPGNHRVEFQEASWKSGSTRLTVWCHRRDGAWVVLDAIEEVIDSGIVP